MLEVGIGMPGPDLCLQGVKPGTGACSQNPSLDETYSGLRCHVFTAGTCGIMAKMNEAVLRLYLLLLKALPANYAGRKCVIGRRNSYWLMEVEAP